MAAFVQETYVQVKRDNLTVPGLEMVAVRIGYMSNQEAQDLQGSMPFDSYWMSSMAGQPDIHRRDLLIDQINIDPVTSSPAVYRVFGNPRYMDQSFVRFAVEKAVGTQTGLGVS